VLLTPLLVVEADDYEEDFEAYDDDFEDDEGEEKAPTKVVSKLSAVADDEMKKLRQSMEQENSQAMERKQRCCELLFRPLLSHSQSANESPTTRRSPRSSLQTLNTAIARRSITSPTSPPRPLPPSLSQRLSLK
jgi:hypothetical protein